MSSAKSLTWDWMSWGRLFMYSKKRSGPRTEPCGTPELTGTSSEDSPSKTTAWVRPTKNDFIHVSVLPLMPCWESLKSNLRWLTLTKALLKSSRTRSISPNFFSQVSPLGQKKKLCLL